MIHALLGEPDQAFEWLDEAFREREPTLIYLSRAATTPIYAWKAKYGGMDVSQAQEAKQLRDETQSCGSWWRI